MTSSFINSSVVDSSAAAAYLVEPIPKTRTSVAAQLDKGITNGVYCIGVHGPDRLVQLVRVYTITLS